MPSRRRQLEVLMKHFKKFQSITKNLQQQGLTPAIVRPVFKAVVEDYPEMGEYLGDTATTVCSPDFENGLVKLINGWSGSMTADKKAATKMLKIEGSESSDTDRIEEKLGYFDPCKRRKVSTAKKESIYIDCSFIVVTSNTVERLFSTCKHVLTDSRKSMSPIMFEAIIFLKVNKNFWSVKMVASAMQSQPKEPERDRDEFYSDNNNDLSD